MEAAEILKYLSSIDQKLRDMNGIGGDVKTIKKDVAELDKKLDSIHEKTISNSKDIGFLNTGITEIKKTIKDKNDNLWNEIRRHEDFHKEDRKEIIKEANLKTKNWVYGAIVTAVSAIALSIATKFFK